jgi:hypothetical protein
VPCVCVRACADVGVGVGVGVCVCVCVWCLRTMSLGEFQCVQVVCFSVSKGVFSVRVSVCVLMSFGVSLGVQGFSSVCFQCVSVCPKVCFQCVSVCFQCVFSVFPCVQSV